MPVTTVTTITTRTTYEIKEHVTEALIANHLKLPDNELAFEWDDYSGDVSVTHTTTDHHYESSKT